MKKKYSYAAFPSLRSSLHLNTAVIQLDDLVVCGCLLSKSLQGLSANCLRLGQSRVLWELKSGTAIPNIWCHQLLSLESLGMLQNIPRKRKYHIWTISAWLQYFHWQWKSHFRSSSMWSSETILSNATERKEDHHNLVLFYFKTHTYRWV